MLHPSLWYSQCDPTHDGMANPTFSHLNLPGMALAKKGMRLIFQACCLKKSVGIPRLPTQHPRSCCMKSFTFACHILWPTIALWQRFVGFSELPLIRAEYPQKQSCMPQFMALCHAALADSRPLALEARLDLGSALGRNLPP